MVKYSILSFIIYILFTSNILSQHDSNKVEDTKSSLSLNIFLEGPLDVNTGLMRTDLLDNALLPLSQPYNQGPYFYSGTESFSSISDIPSKMVDWVLIELRQGVPSISGAAETLLIETTVGILLEDGKVVKIDGSPLEFNNLIINNPYYILVRHRNHLDVLSATPIVNNGNMIYSFSNSLNAAFGSNQLKLKGGKYAMFAGDYQSNGIIQISDFDIWKSTPAILKVYLSIDGNLDGVIQVTDFDLWKTNGSKMGPAEVLLNSAP